MARDRDGSRADEASSAAHRSDGESYLGRADLDEILAALALPPAGLRHWFDELQRFCAGHGGARYYGELMELISACQDRLERGPTTDRRESE